MTAATPGPQEKPSGSGDGPITRQEVEGLLQDLRETTTQRVENERRAREAALIAQEHRLIPAFRNVFDTLFKPEHKNDRSSAITALVWCCIPSSAVAAASTLGLLTALFTAIQVALLHQQNARLDVQNALAEGQRRAGLMVEFDALLTTITEEQKPPQSECEQIAAAERCWRSLPGLGGTSLSGGVAYRVFVPSAGTIARAASLTQALRPYFQLAVGDDQPEICDPARSGPEHPLRRFVVQFRAGTVPVGMSTPEAEQRVREIAAAAAAASWGTSTSIGWLTRAGQWLTGTGQVLLQLSATGSAPLSCRALSPERARVFAAMVAAQVDLGALGRANANFARADFAGMSFDSRFLTGVNLRGASFRHSRLLGTTFIGSDLRDADFTDAELTGVRVSRSKLDGATLPLAVVEPDGFGADDAQARAAAQFWENSVHGLIVEQRSDDGSEVLNVPEGERLIGLEICDRIADPLGVSALRRVPVYSGLIDDPKGAIVQELTYADGILVGIALSFARLDYPVGRGPIWHSDRTGSTRRLVFVTHAAECR